MQEELSSSRSVSVPASLWRRPSVISLLVVIGVLAGTMGWSLWRGLSSEPVAAAAPADGGLPWQVQTDADGGSQVFGLTLGASNLAEARQRFGDELHWGLIVPNGGEPALEAFVDGMRAGFVTGKLVLAFEADNGWLARARERATDHEVGEGGRSRRYRLSADDQATALESRLVALAFVPSVRLDADMVQQRFGEPAERVKASTGELQWLYPAMGVAVALPPSEGDEAKARAVIQYVAPRDFEARLRAPLRPEAR